MRRFLHDGIQTAKSEVEKKLFCKQEMIITAARLSKAPVSFMFCLMFLQGCNRYSPTSSIQDASIVQPSKELTTRCIGRYLIDLPSDLALTPFGGQTIDGVQLRVSPATVEEFKKAVAQRTVKLTSAVVSRTGEKYPALRQTLPLPPGIDGVLFDRAKLQGGRGRMSRVLEVLAWRDGYLINAEVDGIDTTFPEEKDNETLHAHVKTDVPAKTRQILDMVSRTSGRSDVQVPAEPGVCLVNGFVRGTATAGESIGAIYKFAHVDNFFMRIASTSLSRGKNTILDRIENIRPLVEKSGGKIFRKSKRQVDGKNGYEAAYSMLTDGDAVRGRIMFDRFIFELNSAEGSAHKPRISVELSNGESIAASANENEESEESTPPLKKAPLSTATVESLWDAVVPTIRVRPNAF